MTINHCRINFAAWERWQISFSIHKYIRDNNPTFIYDDGTECFLENDSLDGLTSNRLYGPYYFDENGKESYLYRKIIKLS